MKKLKKLSLKKEIEREAEALEKEVSGRKDLDHITVSEDMEEALFQKIQDYEYEKRAKIVYRKKKKRYAIIAVAAVFILVFGSVMTGVGSKSYWKEVWERDAEEGKISYIDVDEMPSQETEDIDEVQVYKEIRSELGILPVRLVYNTEGMVLKKYQINKELKKAILLYEKGNEVIKYTMYMSNIDSSFGQKEPDNLIDEYIVPLNNGVEVQVKEYEEKEEKIKRKGTTGMLIRLDMASATPIYVQLRNQIVMGIGTGALKVGEKLPTVRQMAADAGVNTMTVNKTYQLLKAEGFIEIDRRRGAVVNPVEDTAGVFREKLEGELALLGAEAKIKGMNEQEFLQLCETIFENLSGQTGSLQFG